MGDIRLQRPALLVIGAFGQTGDSLEFVRTRVMKQWGDVQLASDIFDFDQTNYYSPTMGSGLKKQFWAVKNLIDKAELPKIKHLTNEWEVEYADKSKSEQVVRPVNIDPGYLTEAKLVLATTKDRDHRLYLADGIFGEVTLYYQRQRWRVSHWTYPDYQTAEYHQFFSDCRNFLREQYQD
ncbi:MAG: GTP-binding protein [Planctomycetaceae bacterium]|nr:GTP-binding protein [Planctomycetaceae bacterium]|tara:strand:- start:7303 stop:7842 length:540 start_codon:yes stop_codon:yes gene_type:complete